MAPPRGRLGTSTLRREGRSGVATETGCSMILGRQDEFDTLRSFVARIPEGRSGLLLEGSPGIGKTTLWLEAVSIARQEGFRVLTTRASESEARWSYAGRGDLLAEVDDGGLGGLPPPSGTHSRRRSCVRRRKVLPRISGPSPWPCSASFEASRPPTHSCSPSMTCNGSIRRARASSRS